MSRSSVAVHRLDLFGSNAYLLDGDGTVLVDTGPPGEFDRLADALGSHGVGLSDLDLVVLTHGHGDHAGTASRLSTEYGVPIAAHPREEPLLTAGEATFQAQHLEARLIEPLVPKQFEPVDTDVRVTDGEDLSAYGVPGRVIETPGHTAGSISVCLETGDAIVGDLVQGGYLIGLVWPTRPRTPYYADDPAALPDSQRRLREAGATTLHVGHGGPLDAAALPL